MKFIDVNHPRGVYMAVSSKGIAAQGSKRAMRNARSLPRICFLGVGVAVLGIKPIRFVALRFPPPPVELRVDRKFGRTPTP
jgi:hypothetical protein